MTRLPQFRRQAERARTPRERHGRDAYRQAISGRGSQSHLRGRQRRAELVGRAVVVEPDEDGCDLALVVVVAEKYLGEHRPSLPNGLLLCAASDPRESRRLSLVFFMILLSAGHCALRKSLSTWCQGHTRTYASPPPNSPRDRSPIVRSRPLAAGQGAFVRLLFAAKAGRRIACGAFNGLRPATPPWYPSGVQRAPAEATVLAAFR